MIVNRQQLAGSLRQERRRYRIRIGCHLQPHKLDRFQGVAVRNLQDGEAILECEPMDQSALHGLLAWIGGINVRLIAVEELEPSSDSTPPTGF